MKEPSSAIEIEPIMSRETGSADADIGVRAPGATASGELPRIGPLNQAVLDQIGGRRGGNILNAMTIDVEDYFHVLAFDDVIDRDLWDAFPRRVEQNTNRLLEIFADTGTKATFFTLGWVAERHPGLIRRIASGGHELASHGYAHIPADRQNRNEFRDDVRKAKLLLEDASGTPVQGYRAPTFSIARDNWWAFQILSEEGYTYSSSVFPIRHDLYGTPNSPRNAFVAKPSTVLELPLTTVRLLNFNFPCAGGGYFRLLPYGISRWALRHVNSWDRMPCVFYLHPWEIDPGQPYQYNAPLKSRFRHYINLHRTEDRLRRILRDFSWGRIDQAFSNELAR
jgi:polysaccharide deacetylase family protein (PEP-CTERM system associated)